MTRSLLLIAAATIGHAQQGPGCVDEPSCVAWAQNGECTGAVAAAVVKRCPLACGKCGTGASQPGLATRVPLMFAPQNQPMAPARQPPIFAQPAPQYLRPQYTHPPAAHTQAVPSGMVWVPEPPFRPSLPPVTFAGPPRPGDSMPPHAWARETDAPHTWITENVENFPRPEREAETFSPFHLTLSVT